MALSVYGQLFPPFISMVKSDSVQGLFSGTEGVIFGTVDTINYNGFRAQVGQSCLFKQTDASIITIGVNTFFIVEEKDLIFQENLVL